MISMETGIYRRTIEDAERRAKEEERSRNIEAAKQAVMDVMRQVVRYDCLPQGHTEGCAEDLVKKYLYKE